MTETEEIKNLKIQLSEQQNEIQELKNALGQHDIYKCNVCMEYEHIKNIQSCRICNKRVCGQCVSYCDVCRGYYCDHCISIEKMPDHEKWHYAICQVCQVKQCSFGKCDSCGNEICRSCLHYCYVHYSNVCLFCRPPCEKTDIKCRDCHLNICGLCWQPREFKFLNLFLQNQILTLMLVFKHLTNQPSSTPHWATIVPPKFIKYLICCHLIHLSRPQMVEVPRIHQGTHQTHQGVPRLDITKLWPTQ